MERLGPGPGTFSAILLRGLLGQGEVLAHKGHGDATPWKAHETASLNDSCEWKNSENDRHIGTCRQVQESLVCVRNQPIVKVPASRSGYAGQSVLWFSLGLIALSALGFARKITKNS